MAPAPRYKDHPFWQDADIIDALLRAQRRADALGTGQVITGDEHHEAGLRAERDQLRRMARLDVDGGTWPDNTGFVERDGHLIPERWVTVPPLVGTP